MPRPHKGDRVSFLIRLPRDVAEAITGLGLVDRNAWVGAAIVEKLRKEKHNGTP